MYKELVAEYLDYELPALVARKCGIKSLPSPAKRNIIYSIIGVRRCGKTFHLFQLMQQLMLQGISRSRMLYFPFDDDRLGPPTSDTASYVLEAYFQLVPEAEEGCYLFFDEIQDIPNWESFIRRAAEQYKTTVVVTGS